MALVELNPAEERLLQAAREYADALAVLKGKPPFSPWDALRITATRDELLCEALRLSGDREAGPSIPADSPAPPNLVAFLDRMRAARSKVNPES